MRRKCILSLMLAATMTVLAGCGSTASAGTGTLKVGVRANIPNFGYLNPDTDQYYGFEIDLAQQLAEKLGYESTEYVTVTAKDREEKLDSGEIDCLIAAYTITDERKEKYDFSPVYYDDVSGIVVEKTSMIDNMSDLVGKTIGCVTGGSAEERLKVKMEEQGLITEQDVKGTDFVYVEGSYEELDKELQEGTIDAACMDGCIYSAFADDDNKLLDDVIADAQYAVATQKESKISQSVSDAVTEMTEDGTIDALKDKWD